MALFGPRGAHGWGTRAGRMMVLVPMHLHRRTGAGTGFRRGTGLRRVIPQTRTRMREVARARRGQNLRVPAVLAAMQGGHAGRMLLMLNLQ